MGRENELYPYGPVKLSEDEEELYDIETMNWDWFRDRFMPHSYTKNYYKE